MALGQTFLDDSTQDPLTKYLVEHFQSERITPPLKADGFLRSSSLPMLCPREEVLCGLLNVVRKEKIDPDLNTIFALGSGMHWALQNKILPQVQALVGRWTCMECGESVGGAVPGKALQETLVPRPESCAKCGAGAEEQTYRELYFRNEEFRIGGHPDGFLKLPMREDLGILEAKSISQRGAYEVKNTPKLDHVVQSQIYLWFTGLQWTLIVYWIKGVNGLEGFIEHFVERDEETIYNVQQQIKSIWGGLSGGPLPARICANSTCSRAKSCAVSGPCFEKTP